MKFRKAALFIYVVFHLTIVLCGAVDRGLLVPSRAIEIYGVFTGSANSYGFFAPDVPDQVIAKIESRVDDRLIAEEIIGEAKRARDFRLSAMFLTFAKVEETHLLGRILAAYVFGKTPEAERIVVRLGWHRTPSIAEFRAGSRPFFEEFYEGEFSRRDANN